MKKKIVILGSTGSIGQNTFKILKENKNNFQIELLSTNKKINLILKQSKEFKVKNLIITDYKSYIKAKNKVKKSKIKIYNSFKFIDKILKRKKIAQIYNKYLSSMKDINFPFSIKQADASC